MSVTFVFKVNNVDCPCPSKFGWSLQDVSMADSGRTQDALMWKNRVAQKEKIQLQWNGIDTAKASQILQMFQPEYFDVTYVSPLTNSQVTKTFYRGDAQAPFYWWLKDGLHESISFDIIER